MMIKLLILLILFSISANAAPRYQILLNLANKQVAPEYEGTNYDRINDFGHWVKPSDSCLNTRNFILAYSSSTPIEMSSHQYCTVKSGQWRAQFTDQFYNHASKLHIDHTVPLKEAFKSGAHSWSDQRRCHYNNYLNYDHHLKLVSGTENLKKGDSEPQDYTPPLLEKKCSYLKQWIVVKLIWGLSFNNIEYNSLVNLGRQYNCQLENVKIDMRFLHYQRELSIQPIEACR